MSCGDTSWGWFRHYFSMCNKCGSLVDAETKECDYCENAYNAEQEYDDAFFENIT